jgi:ligand-binding sensor domain-containing protein
VVRNVSLLREQAVYAIAVDVADNKWLATDSGIWIVTAGCNGSVTAADNAELAAAQ